MLSSKLGSDVSDGFVGESVPNGLGFRFQGLELRKTMVSNLLMFLLSGAQSSYSKILPVHETAVQGLGV